MPRLSIVIPTRDRPELLRIAVQSLLSQDFEDWELVLSDNSTNAATRAVMDSFEDARIRYVRANDLSMCDNWEFACSHAKGEYICVLEDKQALKFHALGRIDQILRQERPEVLRWQWDSLEPYGGGFRVRHHGPRGGVRRLGSDQVLDVLVNQSYVEGKLSMPIAHYSAIHRDLLERIRKGPVGRLFPPVAPDYTLGIQILNFCDEVVYLDEGLSTFSDVSTSNGVSVVMKTQRGKDFATSVGGEQVFYDHVPVKALTISGTIYNDYARLCKTLGGRLNKHPLNLTNYFLACFADIRGAEGLGVDMQRELAETERALGEQSSTVQSAVREGLEAVERRKGSWSRRLRKSDPVRAWTRSAKSFVIGRLLGREEWRFRHIQDYLEYEAKKASKARP